MPHAQLDRGTAAVIKGMLGRGDRIQDIAVWFGVSVRVIHAVQSGAVHPFLALAPQNALPPAGPYSGAARAYFALAEIVEAERRLRGVAVGRQCRGSQVDGMIEELSPE